MGSRRLQAELREQFAAGQGPAQALDARSLSDLSRFARVSVQGRWDGQRQFLLDNRTRDGRAGYEVLTPLRAGRALAAGQPRLGAIRGLP
ncbi:MAG: SURF1 family cytochrome oxidase biogenesis protein [Steroidobacteraceae bacterium]